MQTIANYDDIKRKNDEAMKIPIATTTDDKKNKMKEREERKKHANDPDVGVTLHEQIMNGYERRAKARHEGGKW